MLVCVMKRSESSVPATSSRTSASRIPEPGAAKGARALRPHGGHHPDRTGGRPSVRSAAAVSTNEALPFGSTLIVSALR